MHTDFFEDLYHFHGKAFWSFLRDSGWGVICRNMEKRTGLQRKCVSELEIIISIAIDLSLLFDSLLVNTNIYKLIVLQFCFPNILPTNVSSLSCCY